MSVISVWIQVSQFPFRIPSHLLLLYICMILFQMSWFLFYCNANSFVYSKIIFGNCKPGDFYTGVRYHYSDLLNVGRVKRIWYLPHMRAAKVQASLRIRAVSPEPPLLAHTSIESRWTFKQKVRSLAPLNGWACAVKICHDGMLEDTSSLDAAQRSETKRYDIQNKIKKTRFGYISSWY